MSVTLHNPGAFESGLMVREAPSRGQAGHPHADAGLLRVALGLLDFSADRPPSLIKRWQPRLDVESADGAHRCSDVRFPNSGEVLAALTDAPNSFRGAERQPNLTARL
jgi:hypothetical protein